MKAFHRDHTVQLTISSTASPGAQAHEDTLGRGAARAPILGPDPNRQLALKAAKARWADWAGKKLI